VTPPVRVSLVGGLRVHREALAAALDDERRLRVKAPAADSAFVRDADVVLVDAASAEDGLELIRGLAEKTDAAIVVLGAPDSDRDVIAFAELGVAGFVERDAPLDELVSAVVTVAGGEGSVPPRIAATLLRGFSRPASRRDSPRGADLTMREREVVDLIGAGLTNKEIAARLYIEVGTVKNHVHNILDKLKVSRRAEAVAHLRLIESPDDVRVALRSAGHTARHRAG
jgi:two-component system, NarL family, nitrate/nitrite response regulator NarL